jgi:hypothetical protein
MSTLVPFRKSPKTVPAAIAKAFADFETSIGGRPALIATLSLSDLSPEIEAVLCAIGDPDLDKMPLADICYAHGMQPGQVILAYHKAQMSAVQVLAMSVVAGKVGEVAAEIIKQALPHDEPCPTCEGEGKIAKPRKVGRGRPPKPLPCGKCGATGKIHVKGSESQQDRVLDLARIVQKGGGGINIGIANSNSIPAPQMGGSSGSPRVQLQQAISAVLSGKTTPGVPSAPDGRASDSSVVDATVIPEPSSEHRLDP